MHDVIINGWAVLVAGVVGWLISAVWYVAFSKQWQAVAFPGTKPQVTRSAGAGYVIALLAYLVIALAIAAFANYYNAINVSDGLWVGGMTVVGFVATTMLLNTQFAGRPYKLFWIDLGNYALVFLAMGAIIGAWQ